MTTATDEPTTADAIEWIAINAIGFRLANHRHEALHNQAKLDALAASIESTGRLLEPILVEKAGPKAGAKYTLVYGHRRLLAVKQLGWQKINAQICEPLTDAQVLLMRAIENLHREDLNPMEQITAVEQAWEAADSNHVETAKQLGVSEAFVLDRLHIGNGICGKAREIALAGVLGIGHLRELIKITDSEEQARIAQIVTGDLYRCDGEELQRPTVEEVRSQVRARMRDLTKAPWKLSLPFAGMKPCEGCASNTSSDPDLFGETEQHCTDGKCFRAKEQAASKLAERVADHLAKQKVKSVKAADLNDGLPGNIGDKNAAAVEPKAFARQVRKAMPHQSPASTARKPNLTPLQKAIQNFGDTARKWEGKAEKLIKEAAKEDAMTYAMLLVMVRTKVWESLPGSTSGHYGFYGKPKPPKVDRTPNKKVLALIERMSASELNDQVEQIYAMASMKQASLWSGGLQRLAANRPAAYHLALALGKSIEPPPAWKDFKPEAAKAAKKKPSRKKVAKKKASKKKITKRGSK